MVLKGMRRYPGIGNAIRSTLKYHTRVTVFAIRIFLNQSNRIQVNVYLVIESTVGKCMSADTKLIRLDIEI